MTTPATADDSVRIGARDFKQKYAILSSVAPPPAQINNQQTTEEQALIQNFSVGPATALFDNFQIVPNPYSQYVFPTMYAVAEQQCINNWDTAIIFFLCWRWGSLYENVIVAYNGVTTNATGRQHCVFVLLNNTLYS